MSLPGSQTERVETKQSLMSAYDAMSPLRRDIGYAIYKHDLTGLEKLLKEAKPEELKQALLMRDETGLIPLDAAASRAKQKNLDQTLVEFLLNATEENILKPLNNDPNHPQVQVVKKSLVSVLNEWGSLESRFTRTLAVVFDYIITVDQQKKRPLFSYTDLMCFIKDLIRVGKLFNTEHDPADFLKTIADHLYNEWMKNQSVLMGEKRTSNYILNKDTLDSMVHILMLRATAGDMEGMQECYRAILGLSISSGQEYHSLTELIENELIKFDVIDPEKIQLLLNPQFLTILEHYAKHNSTVASILGEIQIWAWRFALQQNAAGADISHHFKKSIELLTSALLQNENEFPELALQGLAYLHENLTKAKSSSLEAAFEVKQTVIEQSLLPFLESCSNVANIRQILKRKVSRKEIKDELKKEQQEKEQKARMARIEEAPVGLEEEQPAEVKEENEFSAKANETNEQYIERLTKKLQHETVQTIIAVEEEEERITKKIRIHQALKMLIVALNTQQNPLNALIPLRYLDCLAIPTKGTEPLARGLIITLLREKFIDNNDPRYVLPQLNAVQVICFLKKPKIFEAFNEKTRHEILRFYFQETLRVQQNLDQKRDAGDPRETAATRFALGELWKIEKSSNDPRVTVANIKCKIRNPKRIVEILPEFYPRMIMECIAEHHVYKQLTAAEKMLVLNYCVTEIGDNYKHSFPSLLSEVKNEAGFEDLLFTALREGSIRFDLLNDGILKDHFAGIPLKTIQTLMPKLTSMGVYNSAYFIRFLLNNWSKHNLAQSVFKFAATPQLIERLFLEVSHFYISTRRMDPKYYGREEKEISGRINAATELIKLCIDQEKISPDVVFDFLKKLNDVEDSAAKQQLIKKCLQRRADMSTKTRQEFYQWLMPEEVSEKQRYNFLLCLVYKAHNSERITTNLRSFIVKSLYKFGSEHANAHLLVTVDPLLKKIEEENPDLEEAVKQVRGMLNFTLLKFSELDKEKDEVFSAYEGGIFFVFRAEIKRSLASQTKVVSEQKVQHAPMPESKESSENLQISQDVLTLFKELCDLRYDYELYDWQNKWKPMLTQAIFHAIISCIKYAENATNCVLLLDNAKDLFSKLAGGDVKYNQQLFDVIYFCIKKQENTTDRLLLLDNVRNVCEKLIIEDVNYKKQLKELYTGTLPLIEIERTRIIDGINRKAFTNSQEIARQLISNTYNRERALLGQNLITKEIDWFAIRAARSAVKLDDKVSALAAVLTAIGKPDFEAKLQAAIKLGGETATQLKKYQELVELFLKQEEPKAVAPQQITFAPENQAQALRIP